MSLTVDQLLAAESSESEEDEDAVPKARRLDGAGKDKASGQAPTLEEALALAQADLSDDEDDDEPGAPVAGSSSCTAASVAPLSAGAPSSASAAQRGGDQLSEGSGVEEQDDGAAARKVVGLDELLAMGSDDSSGDERAPQTTPAAEKRVATAIRPAASAVGVRGSSGSSARAQVVSPSAEEQKLEDFLRAPFNWCLEHEKSLLPELPHVASHAAAVSWDASGTGSAEPAAGGTAQSEVFGTSSSSSSSSKAPALPRLVEAKPCAELRRLLAQELGLPTCVAASGKLVGVGTLRGALVLLDPKLQDVPPRPQVLSPPATEEASAVTAAAFSPDGESLLVGHKSGQLVLWDLASQKIACSTRDVHSSSVVSVSFCRPGWQFALSADSKGSVYFLTFTSTFGRRDCSKQLLLEQSSNIGVPLRLLPVPQVPAKPGAVTHPADTHCLVALCATNATVLLTLHPSAQVLQKMQYNAKDASWIPDAAWLRPELESWAETVEVQSRDPQLCIAYGQTIHLMRVGWAMNEAKGKEDFKVSLIGKYTWPLPIRSISAFNDSVLAVLDGSNRLSVVQLPPLVDQPQTGATQLTAVQSEDVTSWSPVYHTSTSLDGSRDARSHHSALAVFRGKSRTLYVCGMKEVWSVQIGRWGQHIESLVSRNEWPAALDVFLALRRGTLPPLLDFPNATGPRQKAVESRTTQVIQSYLVNSLRPDTNRAQVRQICMTAVGVCVEANLWPVLYKTVFECFKATGHMNIYCNALEPFIVQGRIPRGEMDSEVLSSIVQSYALPLEEEEQVALQQTTKDGASTALFLDCDHCPHLFPTARRLQQLVLCVDVSRLDLNLAIRLFTQHRLWTALVHVYCALGDYVSPLELLVGECGQLAKKCPTVEGSFSAMGEAPLIHCLLVRKLFFFLHRCFEMRAFPLDPKDGVGMVQPSANSIADLLRCIFRTSEGQQQAAAGSPAEAPAPVIFARLLRLSPLGLFGVLAALFTSPSASHAVQGLASAGGPSPLGAGQEISLGALFQAVASAFESAQQEGPALPASANGEFLWFVARSVPRAKPEISASKVMEVVDHLLTASPASSSSHRGGAGRHSSPEEAQQLLIGLLATQESDKEQWDTIIVKASRHGFWRLASWLHERQGEYGKALDCRLQDDGLREGIFEYIILRLAEEPAFGPALVEATLQRLKALVVVDADRCAMMICEQFASVADRASVLERLRGYPQIEMRYLEALLVRKRHSGNSEDRQDFFNNNVVRYIELLCQNSPGAVLPFILENEALPLRECLELCRRHSVTDASVHLLERTGDFSGVLKLVLSDYHGAVEKLRLSFCGSTGDKAVLSRAIKRLAAGSEQAKSGEVLLPALRAGTPWWEGFGEAQRCLELLQNAYELSSRNSNIMTEAQLEELWFGILGSTVRLQERMASPAGQAEASERRRGGLASALQELASKAMAGLLAYLSLPRSLKWICGEFGPSSLGIWKDPLQSMLSGLTFQQGLLQAAKAVAAQDVVKPFTAVKLRGSRGARISPRSFPPSLEAGSALRVKLAGRVVSVEAKGSGVASEGGSPGVSGSSAGRSTR